ERYGTVEELWDHITKAQAAGYGVYIFVQAMKPVPGYARGKDVLAFRAHFGDFDKGKPPEWHRLPDIVVHTSTVGDIKKLQAYYLIGGTDERVWRSNQARLLKHYNDDQSVKDTVRVGRLPGTFHQKATPQLITFEKHCDGDIYALLPTSKEIVEGTAEVKV